MPLHDKPRKSGKTGGGEAAQAAEEDVLKGMEENLLPEEREKSLTGKRSSFSRMKFDWSTPEERVMMAQINAVVERVMNNEFAGAFALINDIYDLVRTPIIDEATQEIRTDQYGFPLWKRTRTGEYEENYSLLTYGQREDFTFRLATQMVEWGQRRSQMWRESIYAKAVWSERFSQEYTSGFGGTVEDRTQEATKRTAEDKYFAVFKAALSNAADDMVRQMKILLDTIKDTPKG